MFGTPPPHRIAYYATAGICLGALTLVALILSVDYCCGYSRELPRLLQFCGLVGFLTLGVAAYEQRRAAS